VILLTHTLYRQRLATLVLLLFALAIEAFAPGSAAATALVPTTVSAVTSDKAWGNIAKSPSSEVADFDGCIFCKSRTCSGFETLLKVQQLDSTTPVALLDPQDRPHGTLPQPPPRAAALLSASTANFNPRGPPSLR
jgi:hypothetical protein